MISDAVDTSGGHFFPPCVQYSPAGIHFTRGGDIKATPADEEIRQGMALCLQQWGVPLADSGVYCREVSGDDSVGRGVSWGLGQHPDGRYAPDPEYPRHSPFIVRFDCDLRVT